MKSITFAAVAAVAAQKVAGHALFQQLWVDGVDMVTQCARVPTSNTPITNVGSDTMRCNVGGARGVSGKCPVAAGGTVTVEMHQVIKPNERSHSSSTHRTNSKAEIDPAKMKLLAEHTMARLLYT
jgi:lytic cellulose monooxygenase (C1-hydroxylating)